jgi:type VI protein secretion system component Hcp
MCKRYLIALLTIILQGCSSTQVTKINLKVEDGIYLPVDIYLPNSQPKALLIVSPGTSGNGNTMYADTSFHHKKIDFDNRGGLTETLLNNNYAVLYFNHRGLKRLQDCLKGDDFQQRMSSLIQDCTDRKIRAEYDFESALVDNTSIYQYVSQTEKLKNIPVISLALSEGSYHISKLIQSRKIFPQGIIFLGGLHGSIADVAFHQLSRAYYFKRIENTFSITKKDNVTVEDVIQHGHINSMIDANNNTTALPIRLSELMNGKSIDKATYELRKSLYQQEAKKFIQAQLSQREDTVIVSVTDFGEHLGKKIDPVSLNMKTLRQYYTDVTPVSERLKSFTNPVIYLHGEFDANLDAPSSIFCQQQSFQCYAKIIEGVGHGLDDESGLPSKKAKRALIESINKILIRKV